jgi:hypothetical protein
LRWVLILPLVLGSLVVGLALVVLLTAGWWAVLVLGYWPAKLRSVVVAFFQFRVRVASYSWLIVDHYTLIRFEFDQGNGMRQGGEPCDRSNR